MSKTFQKSRDSILWIILPALLQVAQVGGTALSSDTALILLPALSLGKAQRRMTSICAAPENGSQLPHFSEILSQTTAAFGSSLYSNTPAIKQQAMVTILHSSAFRLSREADSCMETAPEKPNFRSLIKEINHHIRVSQGKPSPGRSCKSGCENNFSCIRTARASVRPSWMLTLHIFSGALKLSLTLLPFQC